MEISRLSRIRTRLYMGRKATTGRSTAHTTAPHAVENPRTGLLSYGRRDRSWWRASCSLFSKALLARCAPKKARGETLIIQNTNPSVYRARRDGRRNYCTHHSSTCRRQPPERSMYPTVAVIACGIMLYTIPGTQSSELPPGASSTKLHISEFRKNKML